MAQAKIISIGEMVATTTENILILFGIYFAICVKIPKLINFPMQRRILWLTLPPSKR